jgi:hypothetical protein
MTDYDDLKDQRSLNVCLFVSFFVCLFVCFLFILLFIFLFVFLFYFSLICSSVKVCIYLSSSCNNVTKTVITFSTSSSSDPYSDLSTYLDDGTFARPRLAAQRKRRSREHIQGEVFKDRDFRARGVDERHVFKLKVSIHLFKFLAAVLFIDLWLPASSNYFQFCPSRCRSFSPL